MKRFLGVIAIALLTVSCGGGSGGGGSTGGSVPPVPPPVTATPTTTLSSSNGDGAAPQDDTTTELTTTASVSGTLPATTYADIQYDTAVFSSATASPGVKAGTYVLSLKTRPGLALGTYSGTATFRLCSNTPCNTVIQGTAATYTYTITISAPDWSMYQGNASHTGYVNLSLSPSNFSQIWDWSEPLSTNHWLNPATVNNGTVFVSNWSPSQGFAYALDEATGTQKWSHDFSINIGEGGATRAQGSPMFYKGTLYMPAYIDFTENGIVSGMGAVWGINPLTGTALRYYTFTNLEDATSTELLTPTPFADRIFMAGADGLSGLWAFSDSAATDQYYEGITLWKTGDLGGWSSEAETPAVDSQYAYYYTGQSLIAFNVTDGTKAFSISDPTNWIAGGYHYKASPIIGSSHDVIAYSGIMAVSSPLDAVTSARPLISYDLNTRSARWSSANLYSITPAVDAGVIYVARNYPAVFEAVNEADGKVLWSWAAPSGDKLFVYNVVATTNLIFVSTDKHVYAIDRSSHNVVWTYAAGGQLSLSAKGTLLIVTCTPADSNDNVRSNGHVVAIKLK